LDCEFIVGLVEQMGVDMDDDFFWEDAISTRAQGMIVRLIEFIDPSEDILKVCLQNASSQGLTDVIKYLVDKTRSMGGDASYAALLTEALAPPCRRDARSNAEYLFSMNNNKPSLIDPAAELLGAATCGSELIVRELLKYPQVDVNGAVQKRSTPLSGASDPKIIKMLLDAKADVNPTECETVLRGACSELRVDAVKMLLEAKADVNWQPIGDSAVSYAVYADLKSSKTSIATQIEVINLLCDAGAQPRDLFFSYRRDMLQYVCNNREDARVFALVLSRCPELLHVRDSAGRTPLLRMAGDYKLKMGIVEALVDAGADMLATDNENQTVLFHVFYKDINWDKSYMAELRGFVQFLLGAGADPLQGSDNDGNTLLMRVITSNVPMLGTWEVRDGKMPLDHAQDTLCSLYLTDMLDSIVYKAGGTGTGTSTGIGTEALNKKKHQRK
jgi:ankyrin repeat protein